MARINLYNDNSIDTTAVSNLFIDNYMGEANDVQLKVYLYLLRKLKSNPPSPFTVTDIADAFNHTEKDVLRALKYWEDKQLLDLTFDCYQTLVGVHIRELSAPQPAARVPGSLILTSGPAPVITSVASQATPTCGIPAHSEAAEVHSKSGYGESISAYGKSDSIETISAYGKPGYCETVPTYSKPVYSTDKLRAFQAQEETAQLLFVVEAYIEKTLSPSDIKSILFYKDELEFSDDLIDYLIQYCVERGKKDFKYIDKVAISWKEQGITTPDQAKKYAYKYDKSVYEIMNQLGKSSSPTNKEMDYITRWTKDYGFSIEIIIEACERTVMATDKHRFEYAEKILSSWKQANVHKKEDISEMDRQHQRKKSAAPKTGSSSGSSNRFNQFRQNDYDFALLEEELLSN